MVRGERGERGECVVARAVLRFARREEQAGKRFQTPFGEPHESKVR